MRSHIVDQSVEMNPIDIFAQQVNEKIVADGDAFDDCPGRIQWRRCQATEKIQTERWRNQKDKPIEEVQSGGPGQKDEPEPKENVDFFVDNI